MDYEKMTEDQIAEYLTKKDGEIKTNSDFCQYMEELVPTELPPDIWLFFYNKGDIGQEGNVVASGVAEFLTEVKG
jgi:hypothetical protein